MPKLETKEKNFVSAVVYLHNQQNLVEPFFSTLSQRLQEHFEHFELIAVNDGCSDQTVDKLKEWAKR